MLFEPGRIKPRWAALAVGLGCSLSLGACGGGSPATPAAPRIPERFSRSEFGDPARGLNRWDPLTRGRQSVRDGLVNVGHRRVTHRRVYTVTDVERTIDGVRTLAVIDQDFNGGQLAQQAIDYLAEDRRGNVWYFGSYTEDYEGGRFVNATDGWLAGVKGSRPGILFPAHPRTGTSFSEGQPAGSDPVLAQVARTGASKCVPLKCFRGLVAVAENTGTEDTEFKYYAPGIGGVLTVPRAQGGRQETERLINATRLTPRGLNEISNETLRVDHHAAKVLPDVFARALSARRRPR